MKQVLIVNVGNKYSRAVKSIEYIEPDTVYFIYNGDYDKYIPKIQNETTLNYEIKSRKINNFQSIDESYSVSKEIFKEEDHEREKNLIAVYKLNK